MRTRLYIHTAGGGKPRVVARVDDFEQYDAMPDDEKSLALYEDHGIASEGDCIEWTGELREMSDRARAMVMDGRPDTLPLGRAVSDFLIEADLSDLDEEIERSNR